MLITVIALVSFTKLVAGKPKSFVNIPFNEQSGFSLESEAWSECTGEWVHITGEVHINIHGVMNGNRINYGQHINYQGLSGEGQTSGRHYSGSGAINGVINGKFDGSFYTNISFSSIKLNTPGNDNNLVLTSKFKITVNANGDVTVSRFDDSTGCQ